MGLIGDITALSIIALDTNIFVYAYQKGKPEFAQSLELLEKIKNVKAKCFISVLVFEEFLVKIYKQRLEKDLAYYEDFLTNGGLINVVDVNRQIAKAAAKLRAEYSGLRAPDAIHLASATLAGAKIFITSDKRLPGKVGRLKVQLLS